MICERVGMITVKRYLREPLPKGTKVFLEVNNKFREVKAISLIGCRYIARLKPNQRYGWVYSECLKPVVLETPLYIALTDISDFCVDETKVVARAAEVSPVLPIRDIEISEPAMPLHAYFVG